MPAHPIVIIGGGIVGLATAMALAPRTDRQVLVLEAEPKLAAHQTGRNSGVIHAGLYYKPGSLKARLCAEGRESLYQFCAARGIAHERCGKLVVARHEHEIPALDELERRGFANGLRGLRRLTGEEIREIEPHAAGVAGLLVRETGIVNFSEVARAFAGELRGLGATIRLASPVVRMRERGGEIILRTRADTIVCSLAINCAGLHSDRIARLAGVDPGMQIVPFRGEYYHLSRQAHLLVRNLIYPVPDARFPFLGVHFTRMIGGGIEAGPNAVLALARHGYSKMSFNWSDAREIVASPAVRALARRYWRTGAGELWRSLSRRAFVRALQRLVPELRRNDIEPARAGVRAQAIQPDGTLVDDFWIRESEHMIHVLNAPSPAATASIAIGRTIADMAIAKLRHREMMGVAPVREA